MLTEREKKKIRRCCIGPTIVITAILVDLFIGFWWAFLVMLDDMAFNSASLYIPGLVLYLGIVLVYLIAAMALLVKVRSVGKSQDWLRLKISAGLLPAEYEDPERLRQIQGMHSAGNMLERFGDAGFQQAGDAMQAAAAAQTVALVRRTMGAVKKDARRMAEIYGIKVPSAKKYVWLMILVPVLLLTAVYIPKFAASKSTSDLERERAAAVVYQVRDALENGCANAIIDDPAEEYRSQGYQVLGQLYERENQDRSYISLYVGNDGLIDEVNYVLTIDIEGTKEANLERVQRNVEELHKLLAGSGAGAREAVLLEQPELPAAFAEQFMKGSYYDGINIHDENANCSAAYLTDPEDVHNEHNSFSFYLSMGEE